jgi:hypothetical protein
MAPPVGGHEILPIGHRRTYLFDPDVAPEQRDNIVTSSCGLRSYPS